MVYEAIPRQFILREVGDLLCQRLFESRKHTPCQCLSNPNPKTTIPSGLVHSDAYM